MEREIEGERERKSEQEREKKREREKEEKCCHLSETSMKRC